MTKPKGVHAGQELYAIQTTKPADRTYTKDQVRTSALARGRAAFDAARGNKSARDALRDADAVDAATAALDPLGVQTGQPGTDITPPDAA